MTFIERSDYLKRASNYCALAERCTQDVRKKMIEWGVPEEEFESVLEHLRKEKFLDDDRYMQSYVADKWKLDQWGRGKIRNGLYQKGFVDVQIQNALDSIDTDGYVEGMELLLTKKRETIQKEKPIIQMKKILVFGASRGFEEELIWQWLEKEGLTFDADSSPDNEGDSF